MSVPPAGGLSYFRITSATVHRAEWIENDLKLIVVLPNEAPRHFPDQIFLNLPNTFYNPNSLAM